MCKSCTEDFARDPEMRIGGRDALPLPDGHYASDPRAQGRSVGRSRGPGSLPPGARVRVTRVGRDLKWLLPPAGLGREETAQTRRSGLGPQRGGGADVDEQGSGKRAPASRAPAAYLHQSMGAEGECSGERSSVGLPLRSPGGERHKCVLEG